MSMSWSEDPQNGMLYTVFCQVHKGRKFRIQHRRNARQRNLDRFRFSANEINTKMSGSQADEISTKTLG